MFCYRFCSKHERISKEGDSETLQVTLPSPRVHDLYHDVSTPPSRSMPSPAYQHHVASPMRNGISPTPPSTPDSSASKLSLGDRIRNKFIRVQNCSTEDLIVNVEDERTIKDKVSRRSCWRVHCRQQRYF